MKGCLWVCTRLDTKQVCCTKDCTTGKLAWILSARLHDRDSQRSELSLWNWDAESVRATENPFLLNLRQDVRQCIKRSCEWMSGCVVCVWYDCLHTHINIPLLSLSKINKSFRLQHHPRRGETELRTLSIIFIYSRDEAKHCEWKEEVEIWKYLSLSSAKWYVFTSARPTNEFIRKTDH